ncbi:hypothetical protein FAK_23770 [Desulfoferula mesophila]|uniref:Uncharacterized protein n=1 Tax=Desulfoferula mesophila TaxID=3058419 RepID=A0AAU9EN59_9BACT|nr:hypothetical protein FAK_23770 [Desulfoferula mesophilus]
MNGIPNNEGGTRRELGVEFKAEAVASRMDVFLNHETIEVRLAYVLQNRVKFTDVVLGPINL